MRKLKTASALLASAAALTLGGVGLAAPANAAPLAIGGTAYTLPGLLPQGGSVNLQDDAITCTSLGGNRLSAESTDDVTTFDFYDDDDCGTDDLVGTAEPDDPALVFQGPATHYKVRA